MHENHASIVALHRLKPFFKKSADTFASTQYYHFILHPTKTQLVFRELLDISRVQSVLQNYLRDYISICHRKH